MNIKLVRSFILTVSVGFISLATLASGSHESMHKDKMGKSEMTNMMMDNHDKTEDSHSHMSWVDSPNIYKKFNGYQGWSNIKSAKRGAALYDTNCGTCHGASGKGDGPAASNLDHKPSNLTKNFHKKNGSNDSYLFWRITTGGTEEPFKSQNSLMPAFKDVLSVTERWDILTFIHHSFHGGFSQSMPMDEMEPIEVMHTENDGQDN